MWTRRWGLAVMLLFATPAAAGDERGDVDGAIHLRCPREATIAQVVEGLDASWTTLDTAEDRAHGVTGASLYSGHPRFSRQLKPISIEGRRDAGDLVTRYARLAQRRNGIFFACHYDRTSMIVATEVQPQPDTCTIRVHRAPGRLPEVELRCELADAS